MTDPERQTLLAALLHERFSEHGWFTRHYNEGEGTNDRLEQLRRRRELEAATDDYGTEGVPDQEVA
jgi:hypothetical protein